MVLSEKIGFIGAGKMGESLIRAIIEKGVSSPENISASDKRKERLEYLKKETGINIFYNNIDTVKDSRILFLAVKPQDFKTLLHEIRTYVTPDKLIISIAAGIKTNYIEDNLQNSKVIRVMPNTPCQVGEMAGAFCIGKNVSENDIQIAMDLLSSAGKVFLLKEDLLDVVTGLSGSGPAFVSYFIKAFIDAGTKFGLEEKTSRELALQTFLGTSKLLQKAALSPEELIEMVKSPGGTTAAGMEIMDKSEIKNIIIETIEQAIKRSRELGEH